MISFMLLYFIYPINSRAIEHQTNQEAILAETSPHKWRAAEKLQT